MNNDSAEVLLSLLFASGSIIFFIVYFIIIIALWAVLLVSMWKLFVKAGKPGWAALIPFYNIWTMIELSVNNNVMWFIFVFIPGLNLVSFIICLIGLCKTFEKGTGFMVLTILLGGLTLPFLAFGKAEYNPEYKF